MTTITAIYWINDDGTIDRDMSPEAIDNALHRLYMDDRAQAIDGGIGEFTVRVRLDSFGGGHAEYLVETVHDIHYSVGGNVPDRQVFRVAYDLAEAAGNLDYKDLEYGIDF